MIDFIQMIVSGIAVGSSYALMGLAMVIIYKTSEVVNFAQGEMALISTFLTYMVLEYYGFPYYVAFPGALIFAVISLVMVMFQGERSRMASRLRFNVENLISNGSMEQGHPLLERRIREIK